MTISDEEARRLIRVTGDKSPWVLEVDYLALPALLELREMNYMAFRNRLTAYRVAKALRGYLKALPNHKRGK